jgi:hypothetical protein
MSYKCFIHNIKKKHFRVYNAPPSGALVTICFNSLNVIKSRKIKLSFCLMTQLPVYIIKITHIFQLWHWEEWELAAFLVFNVYQSIHLRMPPTSLTSVLGFRGTWIPCGKEKVTNSYFGTEKIIICKIDINVIWAFNLSIKKESWLLYEGLQETLTYLIIFSSYC